MKARLLFLAGALSLTTAVNARVQYSGTFSLGYWSSNRNLDDRGGGAVATLQQKLKLDVEDIRVEADLLGATKDSADSLGLAVRELYVQHKSEDLVIRAGRQIINWGKADLVNPTQRFATNNYRLRSSQPGLQQGGVDALRVIKSMEGFTLDAVAATFGQGSKIPLGPLQQAGLNAQDKGEGGNAAVGLRLSNTDAVQEYSVSYFRGNDVMPVYRVGAQLLSDPVHPKLQAFGADYAYNLGDYAIKVEAAYTRNLDKSVSLLPLDQLHVVAGVEQKLADYTISVLYSQKRVQDFQTAYLANPIARFNLNALDQLSKSPRDLFIRLSRVFDDLDGGFTVVLRKSLTDSSGAMVFQYEKVLLDGITLALGFDRFFGSSVTYTGALRRNNVGFAVIRISF